MKTRWEFRMTGRIQLLTALTVTLSILAVPQAARAGQGFRNNSVGGVSIDAEGVLGPAKVEDRRKLLDRLRRDIKGASEDMTVPVELRMISLKAIEDACQKALRDDLGKLPDEVRFLAGIQRLQYVFVYPDSGDIVLAGPGEGWRVDDEANVVGVTTGRPVLRLDDLLVALRYANEARTEGISCSIDPTEEGYKALGQVLNAQRRQRRLEPALLEARMKRAFGPQQVSLTGIPATSHFARVLVAADYRMKRIAMKLQKSGISGLPSYLDLIKSSRVANNVNPRWWMACNYEPMATSADRLAWELRGPGVKVMTEDDFVDTEGKVSGTGRTSAPAQRWADMMTNQYDSLSGEDAIFGELRNVMDMCVVAALIAKEDLLSVAGLSMPTLSEKESPLEIEKWNAPRMVPPEVSFLKTRGSWIVTASGGVQIESWQVASRVETESRADEIRRKAAARRGNSLWWQ